MAQPKTVFVCSACGTNSPRWLGRCPGCGEWNTLAEERAGKSAAAASAVGTRAANAGPVALGQVRADEARRISTGLPELDRVLGGGAVAGGVVLVGGDPGIGKSTLLMQMLAGVAAGRVRALYVTGEESAAQVALRAERLGGEAMRDVEVLATTDLGDVESALVRDGRNAFAMAVIDSIQTIRAAELESAAGSVGQLREVTARLVEIAKSRGISLFLIGHVTKEGALAGPKVLEHLVDAVLSFEGDHAHAFRLLRSTKNRFGPAQEVAVFEMVREGLREVADPSAMFLAERPKSAAGSVVVPTAEGSRPLLVEVQALVAPAVYGAARRVASGLDANRLAILLAVLERKAEVHVLDRDVFASVAGGARVDERALDLGIAVAVVSSLRERAIPPDLAIFGELGLAGEARAVPRPGPRIAEARKLGFARVILPRGNFERLTDDEKRDVELHPVSTLTDALMLAFG